MKDIRLDEEMDLGIAHGDLVISDAEQQHQELILIATQGSFRKDPLIGVGIASYYKSSFTGFDIDRLKQNINIQLQYDGYQRIKTIINSFEDIQIKAER